MDLEAIRRNALKGMNGSDSEDDGEDLDDECFAEDTGVRKPLCVR